MATAHHSSAYANTTVAGSMPSRATPRSPAHGPAPAGLPRIVGPHRALPSGHIVLIEEVALRFRCTGDQVRAHDRRPRVIAARHAAFWALHQAGLSSRQIADYFDLHHSSVLHGLARAERRPDWQALAAPTMVYVVGEPRQALPAWLARGLRGAPPAYRHAVRAYALCTLTGWERHSGATCAAGLLYVLAHPAARAALEEALQRCDLAPLITCVDLHAHRLADRGR
jgi:hypothetical protein